LSAARNLGASSATSNWLFFIDADVLINQNFSSWLKSNKSLNEKNYYRQEPLNNRFTAELHGSVLCIKSDYSKISGYDEVFKGYGGEDVDFYNRLKRIGSAANYIPYDCFSPIKHSNEERMKNYVNKNLVKSDLMNHFYMHIKYQAMDFYAITTELPLAMRLKIYSSVQLAFKDWLPESKNLNQNIQINLKKKIPFSKQFSIENKMVINLSIEHINGS
jgi:predicted glycosyltransferase involved in capsule biosynthesis